MLIELHTYNCEITTFKLNFQKLNGHNQFIKQNLNILLLEMLRDSHNYMYYRLILTFIYE